MGVHLGDLVATGQNMDTHLSRIFQNTRAKSTGYIHGTLNLGPEDEKLKSCYLIQEEEGREDNLS